MANESSLDNVDEQVSVGSETVMLVEATKSRSNSVKCGPGGPTGFDPEQPGDPSVPPKSPRPKPKSLTGGDFPHSRTGSKKVYYML